MHASVSSLTAAGLDSCWWLCIHSCKYSAEDYLCAYVESTEKSKDTEDGICFVLLLLLPVFPSERVVLGWTTIVGDCRTWEICGRCTSPTRLWSGRRWAWDGARCINWTFGACYATVLLFAIIDSHGYARAQCSGQIRKTVALHPASKLFRNDSPSLLSW